MAREHSKLQQLRSLSARRAGARLWTRIALRGRRRAHDPDPIDRQERARIRRALPSSRRHRPAQQVLGRHAARARRRRRARRVRRQHRGVGRQQRAAPLAGRDVPAAGAARWRPGAERRKPLSRVLREPLESRVLRRRRARQAAEARREAARRPRLAKPRAARAAQRDPLGLGADAARRCAVHSDAARRDPRGRGRAEDRRTSFRHALRPRTGRRRQRHELHRRRPHAVRARRCSCRLRRRRRRIEQRAYRRPAYGPRAHAARAGGPRRADWRAAVGPRSHAVASRHRADQARIERRAADGERRLQWRPVREGRAVRVLRRASRRARERLSAVAGSARNVRRLSTSLLQSGDGRCANGRRAQTRRAARDALRRTLVRVRAARG